MVGLAAFAVLFAINSAVHSYLVLAYTDEDSVAINVGFYYMANAGGRLLGTLLSGLIFQAAGFNGCLWGLRNLSMSWKRRQSGPSPLEREADLRRWLRSNDKANLLLILNGMEMAGNFPSVPRFPRFPSRFPVSQKIHDAIW